MSNQQNTSAPCSDPVLDRVIHMIEEIVRPMLAFPEKLRIESANADEATILRLGVTPEDLGKITGTGGRIAESLQAVVTALSVRHSCRILLEIVAI